MLLFRRSLSIVLASSSLGVAACGVELGGLFEGDAGSDAPAPPRDAAQDVTPTPDRVPDTRADTAAEGGATDVGTPDVTAIDMSVRDATIEATFDGAADVAMDARSDPDASLEPDVTIDVSRDGDGSLADNESEPPVDAVAEDSTTDPRPDVAGDTSTDAVADAPADRAADRGDAEPPGTCMTPCNTFANIGQTITRTIDNGPPPVMTGGTILDGTYVATDVVQYNGDSQAYTLSETSIISGNMDTWVSSTNGNAPVRYTTNFIATLNQIAFTFCCPGTGPLTITYTTNGSTLSHVDPGNPNRVITYTRQ